MTDVNLEWSHRGRVCRNLRVNGGAYKTQREQAAEFGLTMVELSKMENGKLDPTPLERAWGLPGTEGRDHE